MRHPWRIRGMVWVLLVAMAITLSDAALSGPLAGLPGTVQKRHLALPVSASCAARKPRV